MKRTFALLLALLLVLTVLAAGAQEVTLDEKLYKQVKDGSGLKAVIRFEKTGGSFSLLDSAANAALSALLPGSELSLRYLRGVGTIKGMEEMELILTRGGQALADLRYIKDTGLESLTSSLLAGNQYVDVRDGGALLALLTGENPAWPSAESLLFQISNAESTWQAAANAKLESYTVRLSLWLQSFTKTEPVRNAANELQTRITATVPASLVKAQIKQLLLDMYNDTELLSLLAQEMDGRQAAAYLQPGMLNGFFQSLDMLPLEGDLVSERLMDSQGRLLENRLSLPMGGARGIRQFTYVFTANGEGGQTALFIEYLPQKTQNTEGAVTTLLVRGGAVANTDGFNYNGTLSLQPEKDTEGFTVDTADAAPAAGIYDFQLLYAPQPEQVDSVAGSSTRDMEFALRLTPQGENALSAQSLQLNIHLQSRLNSRSATYFTGMLTWQDLGTGATLTASIEGNTAAPWTVPTVDPAGAVRVDTLSAAELGTLGEQVRTVLQNTFAATLLGLLGPTVFPPVTLQP
jgi:hypothetical protein